MPEQDNTNPDKLIGKVFASLRPGEIIVNCGYRYGLISGTGLFYLPRKLFHPDARMPNTRVWIHRDEKMDVIAVSPLNQKENLEEEIWEAERQAYFDSLGR